MPVQRIALIISSLSRGGAERVLAHLAGAWAERGRDVRLITLAAPQAGEYALHPRVKRLALGVSARPRHPLQAIRNNARRWRRLRAALREARPDVVLSFMAETNVLALAACLGLGLPVVVSERVDPRAYPIGFWRGLLRRLLYPRARGVVVQTDSVRRWMREALGDLPIRVIPNPALPPEGEGAERGAALPGRPLVAAMGRLDRQKGFDLLLRAFALAAPAHPAWSVAIAGEGEERERLRALAVELGVAARVHLAGSLGKPGALLRSADLFVLPSRYEGFPNALLEAMTCGLPVVAFECPSGPADIIEHGRNGLLVPAQDVEALAEALRNLMGDEALRRRLGAAAAGIVSRYAPERVLALWEKVLAEASGGRDLPIRPPGP